MSMVVVQLTVEVDETDLDGQLMSWVDELVEKGREWGDVTSCTLTGLPPVIHVVKNKGLAE